MYNFENILNTIRDNFSTYFESDIGAFGAVSRHDSNLVFHIFNLVLLYYCVIYYICMNIKKKNKCKYKYQL